MAGASSFPVAETQLHARSSWRLWLGCLALSAVSLQAFRQQAQPPAVLWGRSSPQTTTEATVAASPSVFRAAAVVTPLTRQAIQSAHDASPEEGPVSPAKPVPSTPSHRLWAAVPLLLCVPAVAAAVPRVLFGQRRSPPPAGLPDPYVMVPLADVSELSEVTISTTAAIKDTVGVDAVQQVQVAVPCKAPGRPSLDDVERISQGRPAKRRGTGSRAVPHRLNADEREEWQRVQRRGYLELVGSGHRRGGRDYSPDRVGNPLANIVRQWCDARALPFITVRKAVQPGQGDVVEVDASPLRMAGPAPHAAFVEACNAVARAVGCPRRPGAPLEDVAEDVADSEGIQQHAIWRLPAIVTGYEAGTRQQAKELARQLHRLWSEALAPK